MNSAQLLLCVSVAFAASLVHQTASAQSDAEVVAAGRACMSIESRDLRLACFEGIFGLSASPAGPAPAAVADQVAETAAPQSTVGSADDRSPATATPAAAAATQARSVDGETGRSNPPAPEVRIVEVLMMRAGEARFVTESGRVYQTNGRTSSTTRYPPAPFTATLEPGALGSQFLRYGPEDRQRVRVSERD